MTADERTGWRDARLSGRHRKWGFNCPMVDIDWLVIEYDLHKVMALVDYKNEGATWPPNLRDPNLLTYVDLADRPTCTCRRGVLPAFYVRYSDDLSLFTVLALNDTARVWAPEPVVMSEREYVTLLYKLRARPVPSSVLERLAA